MRSSLDCRDWFPAGPRRSVYTAFIRALIGPKTPSSRPSCLHCLCSFILHRMPRTHAHDFSAHHTLASYLVLVSYWFARCMGEPMETGGSFCPTGESTGTNCCLALSSVFCLIRNFRKPVALLPTCFNLVSCLSYSSTLKMEETCSSETSVNFKRNYGLHNHFCENLKS
jgi:hypothetical protein